MRPPDVTQILARIHEGDDSARDELYELAYRELHERAGRMLARGREGTLQATALVHEAWIKLRGSDEAAWVDRGHFLAVAAKAMRSVLVDHARAKSSEKRGGGAQRVLLDEAVLLFESRALDLLALNDALQELSELDPRMTQVVELRFFGGLDIEETAGAIGVGHATVERDWRSARAWLRGRLAGEERE